MRWWRSTRREGRPKSTSSRNWQGSSGASAGCDWPRPPFIGRGCARTPPAAIEPEQIAGAALLPVTGKHKIEADIPQALTATPEDTARDLRDVKRDEAMTPQGAEHSRGRGTGRLRPRRGGVEGGYPVILAGMPGGIVGR